MGKLLTIITIVGAGVIVNVIIFFNISSETDIANVSAELNLVETQARGNTDFTQTEQTTDYGNEPIERLVEIVITPEDVRTADLTGTIGVQLPYNTDYISKEDVLASIDRILPENRKLEAIEEKYKDYVISLRHVEMTEKTKERDSKVLEVVDEYYKTTGLDVKKPEEIPLENIPGPEEPVENPYGFADDLFTNQPPIEQTNGVSGE